MLIGSHIIKTWSSTQASLALSSGEAEYYGVVRATGIGLGHQALMRDAGILLPLRVWTDSSAAMGTAGRQGLGKLRHLECHSLWLQQRLRRKEFELRKVLGTDNPADLFTKHLESAKRLEHLLDMFSPVPVITPFRTTLANGHVLNAVKVAMPSPGRDRNAPRTLLMCHGFGSGLGFFGISNFGPLAQEFDQVVALDWLGMGGSSRPGCRKAPRLRSDTTSSFFSLPSLCDSSFSSLDAVGFFTESMEEFCSLNGLHHFHLLGHSLGGYLAGMYAARYPGRLATVTLASPAGLISPPTASAASSPMSALSSATPHGGEEGGSLRSGNTAINFADIPLAMRLLDTARSANVTPQQIIRAMGETRGKRMVHQAVERRFRKQDWPADKLAAVSSYLYHITVQPGSGEYAMNALLTPKMVRAEDGRARPRVYARLSLEENALGSIQASKIPMLVLYGDDDWLFDPDVKRLVHRNVHREPSDSAVMEVEMVPNAGHHLYMDSPSVFNRRVATFCASHDHIL